MPLATSLQQNVQQLPHGRPPRRSWCDGHRPCGWLPRVWRATRLRSICRPVRRRSRLGRNLGGCCGRSGKLGRVGNVGVAARPSAQVGVSEDAMQRLWQASDINPHRTRTFKRSNAPDFEWFFRKSRGVKPANSHRNSTWSRPEPSNSSQSGEICERRCAGGIRGFSQSPHLIRTLLVACLRQDGTHCLSNRKLAIAIMDGLL